MIKLCCLLVFILLAPRECLAFNTRLHRHRSIGALTKLSFLPKQSFSVDLCGKALQNDSSSKTQLRAFPLGTSFYTFAKSIFAYNGSVPLALSFGLNALAFGVLWSKLLKMLTPTGFFHALVLGTGLMSTLGWRGWILCVSYLFLGSMVTKIRFAEKEKRGIAEGRGGRRGPENVW
jgi:hypothetical protein